MNGKSLEQFPLVRYGNFYTVDAYAVLARLGSRMMRGIPLRRDIMTSLGPCNRMLCEKQRYVCAFATALALFAFQGSGLAAERKPAANPATTAEAHYELGVSFHEQMFTNLDQAIAEYEQAIKLRNDFAEAHYHLGLSYHTKAKLGVNDKALYRKALKEYKLYLNYLPKGPLADKARQNIKAVEQRIR